MSDSVLLTDIKRSEPRSMPSVGHISADDQVQYIYVRQRRCKYQVLGQCEEHQPLGHQ